MIEFEIDGKKISSEPGKTVIEVADAEGIYIPRFCYHRKLSVAANCRMCLVEVEKSGKPLPACATPITGGMKVFTRSPKALAAQRAVMEFLLINHPLDCPICDQGGECELQDLAMGYGRSQSKYNQGKRSVFDKDIGPLVETCMTRCIQCTRCVRFGEEIAGMRELGAYQRGERLEIGTYVERSMRSELSANIIDICPVGALTSKPFRFTARSWEMLQHAAIAPHDCVGSNIYLHTRGDAYNPQREVMRVVPRANEAVNEMWISDRDRFSYTALQHQERLLHPRIKRNGSWETTTWEEALSFVAQALKDIKPSQLGALAAPSSTIEEFYLLQQLVRNLGSNNIDHRIHQLDFKDQDYFPLYPQLGLPLSEVEKLETIILIGAYPRLEQPLFNHRIRKAVMQNDAKVVVLNTVDQLFNYELTHQQQVCTEQLPLQLAKITKLLVPKAPELANVKPDAASQAFAAALKNPGKTAIFVGLTAMHHPAAALIRALAQRLAAALPATLGYLTDGANSAGAWIAGAVPHRGPLGAAVHHRPGLTAAAMWQKPLEAYLLLNIEPELDCAQAQAAVAALAQAKLVVAFSSFTSPALERDAHVLLPVAPFSETAGTYVNAAGMWQSFQATGPCFEQARPARDILQNLGQLLQLKDFSTSAELPIARHLSAAMSELAFSAPELAPVEGEWETPTGIFRIGEWPMYAIDSIVRRALPLQQTPLAEPAVIRVNDALATRLHLTPGKMVIAIQEHSQVELPLAIDPRIPDNNVWIPMGLAETAGFGVSSGVIELRAVESS